MDYHSKYLKYKNKYLLLRNNIEKLKGLQIGGASIEQEKDTKQSETGSFFDNLFSPKLEEEKGEEKISQGKEDKSNGTHVESSQPFGRITNGIKNKSVGPLKNCTGCHKEYTESLTTANGESFCPHCGEEETVKSSEPTDELGQQFPQPEPSARFRGELSQATVPRDGFQRQLAQPVGPSTGAEDGFQRQFAQTIGPSTGPKEELGYPPVSQGGLQGQLAQPVGLSTGAKEELGYPPVSRDRLQRQ